MTARAAASSSKSSRPSVGSTASKTRFNLPGAKPCQGADDHARHPVPAHELPARSTEQPDLMRPEVEEPVRT